MVGTSNLNYSRVSSYQLKAIMLNGDSEIYNFPLNTTEGEAYTQFASLVQTADQSHAARSITLLDLTKAKIVEEKIY